MTYSQKANPDATNSELDSKTIYNTQISDKDLNNWLYPKFDEEKYIEELMKEVD